MEHWWPLFAWTWGFMGFLSAKDLKKTTGLYFLALGLALGGTFVLWTWGQGFIHSWLWDGAWMVKIWGVVGEQWRLGDLVNRVKTFFLMYTIIFC